MLQDVFLRSIALATAAICLTAGLQAQDALALPGEETGTTAPAGAVAEAPLGPAQIALQRRVAGDPRLDRLYGRTDYRPLWLDAAGSGLSARGQAAREALLNADDHGLDPALYQGAELASPAGDGDWSALDVKLSRALLDYVGDLGRGRKDLRERGSEFAQDATPPDPVAAVRRIAQGADIATTLAAVEPQNPQYRRLLAALAELRREAAADNWTRVPEGETLDPGMRSPRVAQLRQRLAATDLYEMPARLRSDAAEAAVPGVTKVSLSDDAGASQPGTPSGSQTGPKTAAEPAFDPDFYDPALEQAVRAFQERAGLAVDGRVGPNTLAVLNTSVTDKIAIVQANLERWRWLPHDLGQRYILVNTAGFQLEAVEGGRVVMRMPVVNGQPARPTPMFSAEMSYLEVNPTWTVPPTIFAQDYLPKLRRDPGYLAEQNITLYASWSADAAPIDPYSVDWNAVHASTRSLPYRLVQAPGPHNALGRIKFMMPNRHSIYLHDTNHRDLFGRSRRALSSGCIRLARPDDMAKLVLPDAEGWDMERLQRTYESGQRTHINLQRPWPVHVAYFTAWVDDDGTTHFYNDVYGRDAELIEKLRSDRLLLAEEPQDAARRS